MSLGSPLVSPHRKYHQPCKPKSMGRCKSKSEIRIYHQPKAQVHGGHRVHAAEWKAPLWRQGGCRRPPAQLSHLWMFGSGCLMPYKKQSLLICRKRGKEARSKRSLESQRRTQTYVERHKDQAVARERVYREQQGQTHVPNDERYDFRRGKRRW